MDFTVLKKVVEYGDVYALVAQGVDSVDAIRAALKKNGATGGTLQRRNDYLSGDPAYLSIVDDHIDYDFQSLEADFRELMEQLIPENSRDEPEGELKSQKAELIEENQILKEKCQRLEESIRELEANISETAGNSLRRELERKVLVASSISVGPKKHISDECFLVDPEELLDVDACVARYGGELDSFYSEIPTDTENLEFEPGHELTEKNHALRTMKTVGTKRFFEKRIKDNAAVKKTEDKVGQLFPAHSAEKSVRQKERDKILRNRFISLNNIIKSDKLTNQEKLMMYAMNSEYHNTNVERLLTYAGAHCINANFLINILEDPDVCTTYENTVAFLSQFADASEFRMKLNLARELIEGKWYIMADYNGHKTKFQLVPIEEFNELRKKAGLSVSAYSYKEEKIALDSDDTDDTPQRPDFVESFNSDAYGKVDIPDDGFTMPPLDDEEIYPF